MYTTTDANGGVYVLWYALMNFNCLVLHKEHGLHVTTTFSVYEITLLSSMHYW